MKFSTILTTALAVGISKVSALPGEVRLDPYSIFGKDLGRSNHYGAPQRPWEGGKPAWYFGRYPSKVPKLPCLSGPICNILQLFPRFIQCPTPPPPNPDNFDGYVHTFSNHTGATQAEGYLTFGLVDTVIDCKTMCASIPDCTFVNTYRDVSGKDGSPLLTCSLYSQCHTIETATNTGGQSQADGSTNYIINSDGWCKG